MLRVEGLEVKEFIAKGQQTVTILKNISIEIPKNKITCLIGESGAGKTIFAKTLAALLPKRMVIAKGTIYYNQQPVTYDKLKRLRGSHIFYTPQNASASLNPVIKIKNQIDETSRLEHSQLIKMLTELNFPDPDRILNSYPFALSGGENQRCLLAMAMASKPQLLILDEPTSSLDQPIQKDFMRLIKKIQQQYRLTILLITHNLSIARNETDYIYIMLKGELIEKGCPQELFTFPSHDYTREIIQYSSSY